MINSGGLEAKLLVAGGNRESAFDGFYNFLIKVAHFEAYLTLNFYQNLLLFL